MGNLKGVKSINPRLVTAKILVVDDDFKDTEDEFVQQLADVIMTSEGVVIKSRLTRVPVDIDTEKCKVGGHLHKLKKAIIGAYDRTRKIELD